MCQLIEVKWFIWKLSADQLIILLDRDQCSVSYFLPSLVSEYRKTDTRQCCDPLTAVKTRYLLTSITWLYRGLRCRPIEVKFFWSYPLTRYWFSNDHRLKFNFFKKFIWNMLCSCAAQVKFWFQTDLGHKNSASCYRQGRQLLLTFLAMFTRWSSSMCNLYALIGQNLTGKFMRKIYAASWILFNLTAEADRVLCQLVMFLTFSTGCTKWNSAAIRSLLLFMASLFIGFLVESKSEIRFQIASFSFSSCLMRKRVAKSEAILALCDTFQELHLEW